MTVVRDETVNAGKGRGLRRLGLAAVALTGLAAHPAQAQHLLNQVLNEDIPGVGIEEGVTVLSRKRPEYDPIGINLGEITIRPQLEELVGFDDNATGTPSHQGSLVVSTTARVQALYNHSDTTGFVTLSANDNRYAQQHEQNYTNWTAAAGGTHDFGRDLLTVNYDHANINQTVRGLDVPNLDRPLAYRVDTLLTSYKKQFSRLFVQPGVTLAYYDFDNGTVGNVPYIQSYRNRFVVEPNVTFGYELAPNENIVLVVRDAIGKYRNQVGGFIRDFNDIGVLGGVDFEAGGIWRYRVLIGYESRTFSSAQIKSIQSPVVEAQAIWNPTGLTTITGRVTRRVQDTADETVVGVTETEFALQVDHELRRNVLLQAKAGYLAEDYSQGQGNQELISGQGSATWLMNRNVNLAGIVDFTRRNTTGMGNLGLINGQFGRSFSETRYLLQMRFAL